MEGPQPLGVETQRSIPAQHVENSLARFLKSRLPGPKTEKTMDLYDKVAQAIPVGADLAEKIRPIVHGAAYTSNAIGTFSEAMLVATIGAGSVLVGKSTFINRKDVSGAFKKFIEDAKITEIPKNFAGSTKREVIAFGASPRKWLENAVQAKPTYERKSAVIVVPVESSQRKSKPKAEEVVSLSDGKSELATTAPTLQNRDRVSGPMVTDDQLFNAMFKGKSEGVPDFLQDPVRKVRDLAKVTIADFTNGENVEGLLANSQFDALLTARCQAVKDVFDRAREHGAIVFPYSLINDLVPAEGVWLGNAPYILSEIIEQRPEHLPMIKDVLQSLTDTVAAHQPSRNTEQALRSIEGIVNGEELKIFTKQSPYKQLYLPLAVELRAAFTALNEPRKHGYTIERLSEFINSFVPS